VTKAEMIRRYIEQYPDLGPAELAKKIVKENPGLQLVGQEVSNVRGKMKACKDLRKNSMKGSEVINIITDRKVYYIVSFPGQKTHLCHAELRR
jgi:hypothetical protein